MYGWMRSCPLLCCPRFPPFCFPSSVPEFQTSNFSALGSNSPHMNAFVMIAEMEVLVAKMIQTGSDGATPGFSTLFTLSNCSGETGSEF